jgi:hypothetical protein
LGKTAWQVEQLVRYFLDHAGIASDCRTDRAISVTRTAPTTMRRGREEWAGYDVMRIYLRNLNQSTQHAGRDG